MPQFLRFILCGIIGDSSVVGLTINQFNVMEGNLFIEVPRGMEGPNSVHLRLQF